MRTMDHRTRLVSAASSWARRATCVALALSPIGCATMELQQAGTSERVLSTRHENESAGLVPEVKQDGALVHLQLKSDCRVQSYDRVETTTHYKTVNKTPGRDWAFGIAGAGLAGLGVWGVVDASSTFSNDTSSRTYNPVGSGTETVLGITSLVAGGALLTVAVVDVVRTQRTSDERAQQERKGTAKGTCPGTPVKGATITGKMTKDGEVVALDGSLGITNDDGTIDIDLAKHAPPMPFGDLVGEPYGDQLSLYANGDFVKNVSLAPAYAIWFPAWRREAARSRAESEELESQQKEALFAKVSRQCVEATDLEDCMPLRALLARPELTDFNERIFDALARSVPKVFALVEATATKRCASESATTCVKVTDASLGIMTKDLIYAQAIKAAGTAALKETQQRIARIERLRVGAVPRARAEEAAAARRWEAGRPAREAQEQQERALEQQKELARKSCFANCAAVCSGQGEGITNSCESKCRFSCP